MLSSSAAERPPEFASLSVLPPVEPPFPDPPVEEPDPEPPPELDESEPEPEVSELPGFPDCWASCSFCCSTLFTVAATLLLDNRSMILVLVSTMVLPLASVTSLSGASAPSASPVPNTICATTLAQAYPVVVPRSLLTSCPTRGSRAACACTIDGTVMP